MAPNAALPDEPAVAPERPTIRTAEPLRVSTVAPKNHTAEALCVSTTAPDSALPG